MLLIVTARTEASKYAEAHIADSGCIKFFCGIAIPAAVLECGLNDPRNPYVSKNLAVTCPGCTSEFNNGRRNGFSEAQ